MHIVKVLLFFLLTVFHPGLVTFADVFVTQDISLDGSWETGRETIPNQIPKEWQTVTLPGIPAHQGPTVWFRRVFEIPKSPSPRRYVLHFKAVTFVCQVFVNDRPAGKHEVGFTPFDIDITSLIRPGKNTLAVRVSNHQAILGDYPIKGGLVAVTIGDKAFTAPSGSQEGRYWGIHDGVSLRIFPPTYIEDIYVKPSVRKKSIFTEVTVRNTSSQEYRGKLVLAVLDDGKVVAEIPAGDITVPGGSEKVFSGPGISAEKLVLWWPVNFRPAVIGAARPKLYYLSARLLNENGTMIHEEQARFGYREFRTDGEKFRLNEVPMYVFGTGAHYGEGSLDPKEFYRLFLQTGARLVRLHGMLRNSNWYNEADEQGILLKAESAMFGSHQHFAITAPIFWKNCEQHLTEWMRSMRNHPAIVIWSLSNEMGLDSLGKITDPEMRKLYRKMQILDATRPMEAEADGDIGGIASIINIHCWWDYQKPMYPENNYWLERQPVRMGYRCFTNQRLRGKPLYIGEFSPDYTDNMDQAAIVAGDRAYVRDHDQRYGVYGEITRGRIEGYRWTGVAGIGPWTIFETGAIPSPYTEQHRTAYRPIALLMRDAEEHFYGGREYVRRLMVLNDSLEKRNFRVVWKLNTEHRTPNFEYRREETFELSPAEHKRFDIKLRMPKVDERTVISFSVQLFEGKILHDQIAKTYWVFPPVKKEFRPEDTKIFLYDSGSRVSEFMTGLGISVQKIKLNEIALLKPPAVLVIGAGAAEDELMGEKNTLIRFVNAGGVVVCLEQTRPGLVPGLIFFNRGPHSINFVRSADHSIWTEPWLVTEADLRWWQGGLAVTREMYTKPAQGAFHILADGGNGNGGTSLVEIVSGHGRWIASQFKLTELLNTEPMAGEVLTRILRSALNVVGHSPPSIGVLADDLFLSSLKERGTPFTELSELTPRTLQGGSVVILRGTPFENLLKKSGSQVCRALRTFAENGGTIYLKDLSIVSEIMLQELLPGITWAPSGGSQVIPIPNSNFKMEERGLLSGLGASDFRWCDDGPDTQILNLKEIGKGIFKIPGAHKLTEPEFLQEVPCGKGRIVIDQIDWFETRTPKAMRIGATLLTNLGLGGTVRTEASINKADFFSIDLSKAVNRSFRDETADDGRGGWTDQGSNDLRDMPTGNQVLRGVPYKIESRNGGEAILLAGGALQKSLPKKVTGIKVGRKAAGLVFLHGCAWAGGPWNYVVNFADGRRQNIPVQIETNVKDWWANAVMDLPGATVAWVGNNTQHTVTLYSQEWINPRPEVPIQTLDIVNEGSTVPFILAITGRTKVSSKPVLKIRPPEKVELQLPFTPLEKPITFTAGPVSVTVDNQGNLFDWKITGKKNKTILNKIEFAPRNSQWVFPAEPNLKARIAQLKNGSKLIVVEGRFAYLEVEKYILIRSNGEVALWIEARVKDAIKPEDFQTLRLDCSLNSSALVGGTFNGIPLAREFRGQVIDCRRGVGRFEILGPDKSGLLIQMPPTEYYLFDYRPKPTDPPGSWDMPVEIPFQREAGSKIIFGVMLSPIPN
jgi:hypothetical protein